MSDLVTWLRAQLDEDERVAPLAAEVMRSRASTAQFGDRLLAEIQAKRAILDAFPDDPDGCDDRVCFGDWKSCSDSCAVDVMRHVLRLLALPYADRPGFDESWRV